MDIEVVVAFVLAVFLLSIAPGPDMMFIIANSLTGGPRAGLVAAVGMSTGLAVHTFAAAFGLSALLRLAPWILDGVRVAGAVFLIYLAVDALRAGRQRQAETPELRQPAARSIRKVYLMATLTNIANPKVVLFYLAFIPQFLSTGTGSWPVATQLLALGGLFVVVGLLVDGSVGVLSGRLAQQVLHRPAVRRRLDQVAAVVFGALAVRLIADSR
ncbi:LysE family translocator [Plantactinospora solaniradicis]|uniref:LysE family translocator n=1 Tax=Plantactinospora solaniradicis TaxID=1723736 RepID=A0ABW1KBN8_9ACTN